MSDFSAASICGRYERRSSVHCSHYVDARAWLDMLDVRNEPGVWKVCLMTGVGAMIARPYGSRRRLQMGHDRLAEDPARLAWTRTICADCLMPWRGTWLWGWHDAPGGTASRCATHRVRDPGLAGPGSAYESFLVGMPDGTWGYWIAHGSSQPGFSRGSGCCQWGHSTVCCCNQGPPWGDPGYTPI